MNSQMGFSSKLRRLTAPVCVMIRGELAIGARLRACRSLQRRFPASIVHGFLADYRPSYNAADAKDGWARMLAWFKQYGAA
jgi:dienelactone hydrolase